MKERRKETDVLTVIVVIFSWKNFFICWFDSRKHNL